MIETQTSREELEQRWAKWEQRKLKGGIRSILAGDKWKDDEELLEKRRRDGANMARFS